MTRKCNEAKALHLPMFGRFPSFSRVPLKNDTSREHFAEIPCYPYDFKDNTYIRLHNIGIPYFHPAQYKD
jgi:hypothetical protein